VSERKTACLNRDSRIDFCKTIAMFGVLWLHVVSIGVINCVGEYEHYFPSMSVFEAFLHGFASCAVNCFAITSGYLLCKARFQSRRFLSIYSEILFYACVFAVAGAICRPDMLHNAITSIPRSLTNYWYVNAYFGVLLFMPVLNRIVVLWNDNFKVGLVALLVVLFGQYTGHDILGLCRGTSSVWLAILYCVGGLCRLNEARIVRTGTRFGLFLVAVVLIIGGIAFSARYSPNLFYPFGFFWNLINTNSSPLLAAGGVFAFLTILNTNPPKWFSFTGKRAFSVYVIHMNSALCGGVLAGSCSFVRSCGHFEWLVEVLSAIAIYAICILVEICREKIFQICRFDSALTSASGRLDAWVGSLAIRRGEGECPS